MTLVGMPYDLKAKCSWDGDLLHIELPETPKAIHVHHPCGSTFFGVPTRVEQELRSENAKLRELVKDLNKWLWNGADCTECPFTAKCDLNAAFESDLHAHICIGWSDIHDRMRELGIEVG